MRKIFSINIAIVVVLIAFPNLTFATNNEDRKVISLLEGALSTIDQAAQTGNETLDAATTVTEGITLSDILVSQLSVSQQQALGGAGALFQVAKQNMEPQAFSTLSQSVPGMEAMLEAAPTTADPVSSLAGSLSSLMGDTNNTLGTVASLASSFEQLNLSPDMVGQFIPIMTEYVKNTSGQVTANLLQSALMP